MQCQSRFVKFFVALLLALSVAGFFVTGNGEIEPEMRYQMAHFHAASDPLAYLFQIMFILFFISPPIIAVLLFLIWRELKERNRMK